VTDNLSKYKQGVCHICGLAIYIFKAKEDLWKLKYFTMQEYNLQENPQKRNQNLSTDYNSTTDLKFHSTHAKIG